MHENCRTKGGRNMNQEERDELLIKIVKGQEELFKGQEELYKGQQELFKRQEKTDAIINKILQNQDKLFKGQEELANNQKEMKEELTRLGNTVAKIEYEHGTKIDLILDVITGHGERLEEYSKRFEKDEKIIEMQGYKIFGIEKKNKT